MGRGRILVTDAQDRSGLAAVRCLEQGGFVVSGAASTRLAPGLWANGTARRQIVPTPASSVARFISGLERVVREERHDAVLAGSDESLFAISAYRGRLAPHVRLGLPDHEFVRRALDRGLLFREARRVGLSVPDSRICDGADDATSTAACFGFPVIIKAVNTVVECDGRLMRHPSRLVTDARSLREIQQRLGPCIVQRRELGHVVSFCGIATDNGLLATLVARYRRLWPPSVGNASFAETIAAPSALAGQVRELLAGIGWRGVFQLEFVERDDGSLTVIDLNPRLYGSLPLARAAGAPLATLWCEWLAGRDPAPATAKPGVAYRWEDADTRHVVWLFRSRRIREGLAALIPRTGVAHAYFSHRDPLPFIIRCAELARDRVRRARRELHGTR